jgi:urea transport system permease protein
MTATDFSAALSNSLSLSSILILTALGLAITFGVMRVINMAHGEMVMLGAYTAFVVTDPRYLGLNVYWAIPASFIVIGFFGYLLEVCLIRFLYGRPLDTLLATWGVGMILQQSVQILFGSNVKEPPLVAELSGGWTVGGLTIPKYRIFIVGVTLACLAAVYLWFYKTSFGLKIRAVVQNRAMASALGISTRRVDSLTFAFATGLAGVAGCIMAFLYGVSFNMGEEYVVNAFMVVILGGLGQVFGSVASGVIMGSGSSFLAKYLGDEITAKVYILLVIIGFIMIRPSGLFRTKERTYD